MADIFETDEGDVEVKQPEEIEIEKQLEEDLINREEDFIYSHFCREFSRNAIKLKGGKANE